MVLGDRIVLPKSVQVHNSKCARLAHADGSRPDALDSPMSTLIDFQEHSPGISRCSNCYLKQYMNFRKRGKFYLKKEPGLRSEPCWKWHERWTTRPLLMWTVVQGSSVEEQWLLLNRVEGKEEEDSIGVVLGGTYTQPKITPSEMLLTQHTAVLSNLNMRAARTLHFAAVKALLSARRRAFCVEGSVADLCCGAGGFNGSAGGCRRRRCSRLDCRG